MTSRIPHLLQSIQPRDAARLDLGLIRAGLIIALSITLLTARLPTASTAILGPVVLRSISAISLMFTLILASRLGSDSVGDVSTGLLGLIRLTGTTPWQWVVFRLSQVWISFASVWIVRAPAVAFMWTLGGVRLETILRVEAALLLVFFLLSNLALLLSFGAPTRRQIAGRILLLLFLFNTLIVLPESIAMSLNVYWPQWVGPEAVDVLGWVSDFGLNSQFLRVTGANTQLIDLLPGAALYGGIAIAVLLWFWRLVSTVGTMTVEDRVRPQSAGKKGAPRVSRRCWDDALAWQAFVLVGRGGRVVRLKIAGYLLLALISWQAVEFDFEFAVMLMLPVLCGGLLMNAINKSGECLTREINDKTIGTLLLTPHNYNDLAAGWRRGAWRLAAPDIFGWGLLTLGSFLVNPAVAPPIMLSVGMVLVFSQHFFILSPLMPFTFMGITSGILLIVLFCVPVALCILAGLFLHPWATPLFMAPMLWVFTLVLKRALPYWMDKKLSTIL